MKNISLFLVYCLLASLATAKVTVASATNTSHESGVSVTIPNMGTPDIQQQRAAINTLTGLSNKLTLQEASLIQALQGSTTCQRTAQPVVTTKSHELVIVKDGKPSVLKYTTKDVQGKVLESFHVKQGLLLVKDIGGGKRVNQLVRKKCTSYTVRDRKRYCQKWATTKDGKKFCSQWKSMYKSSKCLAWKNIITKSKVKQRAPGSSKKPNQKWVKAQAKIASAQKKLAALKKARTQARRAFRAKLSKARRAFRIKRRSIRRRASRDVRNIRRGFFRANRATFRDYRRRVRELSQDYNTQKRRLFNDWRRNFRKHHSGYLSKRRRQYRAWRSRWRHLHRDVFFFDDIRI